MRLPAENATYEAGLLYHRSVTPTVLGEKLRCATRLLPRWCKDLVVEKETRVDDVREKWTVSLGLTGSRDMYIERTLGPRLREDVIHARRN